jgi:pimeloyl-ACP methyl ester carboxylesterase
VLLGVALVIGVRVIEPKLAFFPSAGEDTTPPEFGAPFEPSTVDTRDNERLRVWTLTHPQPRATIVYFHGNGGNLSVWAPILAGIQRQRYTVIALDYRGYGMSTGRPSEKGLYRDVEAVLDFAWRRGARTSLVYWGRSLGTTMAAYAASIKAPDGVILEAGFPDARSLVRSSPPMMFLSLFSSYRFPTATFMQRVQAPALVIHGDRDSVIPYELGQQLYDRIPGRKQFVTIRGGDHNDAAPRDPATYWNAIDTFVSQLH